MEVKGEGEVTQIGLIFLGLNFLLDWSKFGLNFGLIGLNFGLIGLNFLLDWSKIFLLCSREKKKHLQLLNNNTFYNKSSCFSWGR